MLTGITLENALLWGTVYGAIVLAVAWLAMVIWAFRDMRARSRDFGAQVLVAVLVVLLNLPGLIIYIFLRPRETLAEAYERSLEEEALLQEIEEKPTCPGCGQRVQHDWQACPYCHTRLKKPCIQCRQMLQLSWELCPYCATPQTSGASGAVTRGHVTRNVRQSPPPTLPEEQKPPPSTYRPTTMDDALEFLDE